MLKPSPRTEDDAQGQNFPTGGCRSEGCLQSKLQCGRSFARKNKHDVIAGIKTSKRPRLLPNIPMHYLSTTFSFLLLSAVVWSQRCPTGHRCHPEATCTVSQTASVGYTCVCGTGYVGNGFECFTVTGVASGGFHTCALISDGSVKVSTAIFL